MSSSSWDRAKMADVPGRVRTSDEFWGLGQSQNGHSKLVMLIVLEKEPELCWRGLERMYSDNSVINV